MKMKSEKGLIRATLNGTGKYRFLMWFLYLTGTIGLQVKYDDSGVYELRQNQRWWHPLMIIIFIGIVLAETIRGMRKGIRSCRKIAGVKKQTGRWK